MADLGPTPAVIKRQPIHTEPAWTRPADIYSPPVAVDRDAQAILEERERERDSAGISLFRRYTPGELLDRQTGFRWLIKGLWADASYGMLAGEMKTLKSKLARMVAVGVASATPILGRFDAGEAAPVLFYVGEGGLSPFTRDMVRIAEAAGVDFAGLPIHTSFDTAPLNSVRFQTSLERDLDELQPALVIVDPLYTYHGTKTESANLHYEGDLLNTVSTPCLERRVGLIIVNHYNQTGSGNGLKRITMAAGGEWVDSWLLLAHRDKPDVPAGRFRLRLDIGSRQWGGATWDLDLDIGRFDPDTGCHDGPITWHLQHPDNGADKPDGAKAQTARTAILELLADRPAELTKTQIRDRTGGSRRTFDLAFDTLIEDRLISHNKAGRTEAGTTRTRTVWAINPNPDRPPSPGCQPGGA